jgi:hypothetical protein
MNRIGILDGYGDYGFGVHKKKGRKRRKSHKRTKQQVKFAKAAKSCARRRSGKFQTCMKKKLKKGRR